MNPSPFPMSFSRRCFLRMGAAGLVGLSGIGWRWPGAPSQEGLLAGASKQRITPPLSVPYLTSSGNGTSAPFKSVHDDLVARALVLDDGREPLALLSVDAIGYDNAILGPGKSFTAELRRQVARRTGLKAAAIMLCGTHTHSAPETIGLTPFRHVVGVPEWVENHLQELVQTVVDAWKRRERVRVFAGTTQAGGIARYRRIVLKNGKLSVHGTLPAPEQVAVPWRLDEELSLLCFERESGSPCAVLMNFTAHPVVAMLLPHVSADYPGAAMTWLEERLPGAVCLFTNGAAGNVNSVKVSTNFDDVALLGQSLGRTALGRLEELRRGEPLREHTLEVRSAQIALEPRACPSLAEAERVASRFAIGKDGTTTRLALKLSEGPLKGELHAMRLGPVRWVSLPGEPFVETGLALKAAGANFVVGYANGYLGYFPIRRAYAEGGYEVSAGAWSRVAPGAAERLEAAAQRLLLSLAPTSSPTAQSSAS